MLAGDNGPLFIYNLASGVDQYTFPALERVQSFPQIILRNLPMQVSAIPGNEWVVVGGDDGFARIFDQHTGQLIDRIHHADGMLSPAILRFCLNPLTISAGIPIQVASVSLNVK